MVAGFKSFNPRFQQKFKSALSYLVGAVDNNDQNNHINILRGANNVDWQGERIANFPVKTAYLRASKLEEIVAFESRRKVCTAISTEVLFSPSLFSECTFSLLV